MNQWNFALGISKSRQHGLLHTAAKAIRMTMKSHFETFDHRGNRIGESGLICAWLIAKGVVSFEAELSVEDTESLLTYSLKEIEIMAEVKRGRKPKISAEAIKLLEAIKFLSVASRDNGQPYQTHIRLGDTWAYAFDGVVSAGCKIDETFNCCPQIELMIKALNRCGKSLTITELDTGRLSIQGEELRALVPCLPVDDVPTVAPDWPVAVIDDRIKTAFEAIGMLASENADDVINASLFLQANSVIATDRKVILEYWHGIDLPPALVIPKSFAAAIVKSNKKLAKFGFSDSSVTFYFEDGSWIKTQRYFDEWPDISGLLNRESFPIETPPKLFEAVEAVEAFSENGCVAFGEGLVISHTQSMEVGAQFVVMGLPPGKQFVAKQLLMCKDAATKIDLTTFPDRVYFFGENVRGAIMCIKYGE